MSLIINKSALEKAQELLKQNKISEAWLVLGEAGYNYARNAAGITDKDNDFNLQNFQNQLNWQFLCTHS